MKVIRIQYKLTKSVFTLIFVILSFCEIGDFNNEYSTSTGDYDEVDKSDDDRNRVENECLENKSKNYRRIRDDSEQCLSDDLKFNKFRIPRDYNFFEIPFQPKIGNIIPPINVTMKARVENIRDIDEVLEEITLDMEITLGWIDWKILAYRKNLTTEQVANYIEAGEHFKENRKLVTLNNPKYLKAIWTPNLYIYDLIEKSQPRLMSDLITLRYDTDGGFVFYLSRVILKLSCPMEFKYYPTDTQKCQFVIRGFSYNETLLNLQWYKPAFLADREQSNFDVQLNTYDTSRLNIRDERYSGLSFTLLLRRKLSYHVIQTYIPSSFLIVITWLCFLMPAAMVEARIGISMTTLLTLTAMFSSVRETSPVTAYVKALDIWMVSCIFSVFMTLFEFTLFTWFAHLKAASDEKAEKKFEKAKKRFTYPSVLQELEENLQHSNHKELLENMMKKDSVKFERYMQLTEKFAFGVFLASSITYNAIYWSWLFICSGFLDWPQINTTMNVADGEINNY